jgi:hypothetical protein
MIKIYNIYKKFKNNFSNKFYKLKKKIIKNRNKMIK